MRRDEQLSLIEGMARPVGPIPQSVHAGSNAELVASVGPLYLTGSVLDTTYGRGRWWDLWHPDPFAYHDRYTVDGVDFCHLPEADRSWDTVVFDPPYVESGSRSTSSRTDFLDIYGLGTDRGERVSPRQTRTNVLAGLAECCRVGRRFVLVKCMEYVAGRKFHDMPSDVISHARGHGWRLHDRIVHASGGGIGAAYRTYDVIRCQRAHSYLLVFAPVGRSVDYA